MPLDEGHTRGLAIAFALVALLSLVLGLLLSRWWRRMGSRERNRIALRGEREAESILAREGFRVVARQATATWTMSIDGVSVEVDVRADLLVRRDGRTFVAEVKTGEMAPDPRHPATRRQLLEYAIVFGAEEVLLVDVPAGAVRSIAFPVS